MVEVEVSDRYQIELPEEARRALGIKPGDRLRVDVRDSQVLLTPEQTPEDREAQRQVDSITGLHKEIWEGVDVDEYINELRGPWPEQ
jgi:AbrB family looped-hinge helix DNA binding protein